MSPQTAPIARNPLVRTGRFVWDSLRDFGGWGGDATHLWPRWIVLRAVGIVFMFVFGGIINEAPALIGPNGIVPAASLFEHLRTLFPHGPEAFFRAPGLLWISSSAGMITALGWAGMLAAVAVVLNLWPRMSLFACWLICLSFVTAFNVFSGTHTDLLILETGLLCIPYAPRGFRPGLGEKSPPLPIALFMVRWFLFRVMLESGVSKLISGESHWRNFTAMKAMYETAPFPTILGFYDFQMPQFYHAFEIMLTFAAELAAPLLAVFAGRRGRWIAFVAWLMLQGGIQLTANFGWLNTAAIGLAIVLFDDQMLMALAGRLRLRRWHEKIARAASSVVTPPVRPWRMGLLRGALWTYFALSIYVFFLFIKLGSVDFSEDTSRPLRYGFLDFKSINPYTVYSTFLTKRYAVEFTGSNDGGVTWRAYRYKHLPQEPDQIVSFIAPRFLRFEATMQTMGSVEGEAPTFPLIALQLITRNPLVTGLFKRDPFPDQPATMIRMRRYQLKYNDLATYRKTGNYWTKTYLNDYGPMTYLDRDGKVKLATSGLEVAQVQAGYGNPRAQTYLATLYFTGRGVERDRHKAEQLFRVAAEAGFADAQFNLGALYGDPRGEFANEKESLRWYHRAAEQGSINAALNLGEIYARGIGVRVDPVESAKWYQQAASQGSSDAQFQLGMRYFEGRGVTKDEVEALVWFDLAAQAGDQDAIANRAVLQQRVGPEAARRALERSKEIKQQIESLPVDSDDRDSG